MPLTYDDRARFALIRRRLRFWTPHPAVRGTVRHHHPAGPAVAALVGVQDAPIDWDAVDGLLDRYVAAYKAADCEMAPAEFSNSFTQLVHAVGPIIGELDRRICAGAHVPTLVSESRIFRSLQGVVVRTASPAGVDVLDAWSELALSGAAGPAVEWVRHPMTLRVLMNDLGLNPLRPLVWMRAHGLGLESELPRWLSTLATLRTCMRYSRLLRPAVVLDLCVDAVRRQAGDEMATYCASASLTADLLEAHIDLSPLDLYRNLRRHGVTTYTCLGVRMATIVNDASRSHRFARDVIARLVANTMDFADMHTHPEHGRPDGYWPAIMGTMIFCQDVIESNRLQHPQTPPLLRSLFTTTSDWINSQDNRPQLVFTPPDYEPPSMIPKMPH